MKNKELDTFIDEIIHENLEVLDFNSVEAREVVRRVINKVPSKQKKEKTIAWAKREIKEYEKLIKLLEK